MAKLIPRREQNRSELRTAAAEISPQILQSPHPSIILAASSTPTLNHLSASSAPSIHTTLSISKPALLKFVFYFPLKTWKISKKL